MQTVNLSINNNEFNLQQCYQCGKCTAGCPVAFAMDIAPNKIIRMLQFGLLEETFRTETIWLCASCATCSTRCPKGVDLAKLMDSLRQKAIERGIRPAGRGRRVSIFNSLFLSDLGKYGRTHEMGLMMKYNLNTLDPLKNAFMGFFLFTKGKLNIGPHRIKGAKDIKRIMENVKRLEAEKK
ncbi:hypothetical protein N752_15800 [Desulforamulus aquiferis]|nr:4Fe-4S dicluster domain-containing protein [Desulforamulus aquiferis]RYD04306.1 hypothetical protein N752_15800 [Desulforamulus aquiferis]